MNGGYYAGSYDLAFDGVIGCRDFGERKLTTTLIGGFGTCFERRRQLLLGRFWVISAILGVLGDLRRLATAGIMGYWACSATLGSIDGV